MLNRRLTWLTCALLIAVASFGAVAESARPTAESGYLDLSDYDVRRGVIPLQGEWEFYWHQLLVPSHFDEGIAPEPTGFVRVPGSWNGFVMNEEPLGGHGYATYRLNLRLPDELADPQSEAARFVIHIPWTFTSYTLWMNGDLVAGNGRVGADVKETIPQFLPLSVPFTPHQRTVELVVQVANFHHRTGGLWNSPLLGTLEAVSKRQAFRTALDAFLIGGILFMAIYQLAVVLWFRDRRASAFLGFTCLVIAVRTLVTSEHLLDQFVGGLSWTLSLKTEYLTGYAFLIGLIGTVRTHFPKEMPTVVMGAAWVIAGAGTAVTLLASTTYASQWIPHYTLVLALFLLFTSGVYVVAAVKNREGARIVVWGGIALTATLLHDFFHYNLMGLDMDLLPIGLFTLLLFQSLALGRRFAAGYRRETALADANVHLLETVQDQLEQVRESRRMLAVADEELRKNIAERLHGRVQTRLLSAWQRLGMLKEVVQKEVEQKESQVLKAVEELRRELDELREVEIRHVSHLLHPSIVRVGLLPALVSLVETFQDFFTVEINADDQVRNWDSAVRNSIPEPVRLVAYRVVEDALANVQAHAEAKTATVSISAVPESDILRIEVADDGRGFDMAKLQPKLGLHAIAARVSTVGGTWRIESKTGEGTRLQADLPLTRVSTLSNDDDQSIA